MDNISSLLSVVSSDNNATLSGDSWLFSGAGDTRFEINPGLMVGLRPDFFSANLTLNAPITNHYFFLLLDSVYSYQWDTPIVNPYNQDLPSGISDLNIDLFYSGLNTHLGDIMYIDFSNPGSITSINFVGFTDLMRPSTPYSWTSYVNTAETFL